MATTANRCPARTQTAVPREAQATQPPTPHGANVYPAPRGGPGPCTIGGCMCPYFIDMGSSVCGRSSCYHSWAVHA